jgi:hypothetical protein
MLSRSESLGHGVDLKTAIRLRPNRSDNRLGTSSTDSVGVRPSPVAATSAGVEARFQTCLAPSSESTAVLRNHSAKGWLPHVPSCSKSKIKNQNSKIPGFSNFVQLCFMEGADAPDSMNIFTNLFHPTTHANEPHSSFPIRPASAGWCNSCQAVPLFGN